MPAKNRELKLLTTDHARLVYALREIEKVDAASLNDSDLRKRTQPLQGLFGREE